MAQAQNNAQNVEPQNVEEEVPMEVVPPHLDPVQQQAMMAHMQHTIP